MTACISFVPGRARGHRPRLQEDKTAVLKYSAMKASKMALFVGILGCLCIASAQSGSRIDSAFQKFWSAATPNEAELYTDDVIKSGVTFDEALQRLKAGRTYTAA